MLTNCPVRPQFGTSAPATGMGRVPGSVRQSPLLTEHVTTGTRSPASPSRKLGSSSSGKKYGVHMKKRERRFTRADGYKAADVAHCGIDHLGAAEYLFASRKPNHFDSAGYLSHLGIELLMKAWLLDRAGYFPDSHLLIELHGLLSTGGWARPLASEEVDLLQNLDSFKTLRYLDPAHPTEIGDEDLALVRKFARLIFQSLPKQLLDDIAAIKPGNKAGRILMEKPG